MRKVGALFWKASNRVLNLHPALLPSFRACTIQDAYEYGVKVTGVTVHWQALIRPRSYYCNDLFVVEEGLDL